MGVTVSILRYHPLHQNSLESMQDAGHAEAEISNRVLLKGRVRVINGVKDRDVSYIVEDQINN